MCLTTKQKWPKIAWKPITVYKVVYGCEDFYKTMFQKAKIRIGKTYRESVYNILKNRQSSLNIDECKKYYEFYEGLHSVTEKDAAKSIAKYFQILYPTEIVECIIPRFSFYWIGNDNDIVSNKLKYVKLYNYENTNSISKFITSIGDEWFYCSQRFYRNRTYIY